VKPLLASFTPTTDGERRALELLRDWDGSTGPTSTAAAVAILTFKPFAHEITDEDEGRFADVPAAFSGAVTWLETNFGKVDVPLGTVQRLHRGTTDLAVGGGPDVIAATHSHKVDGHLVGFQGDSYVMIVDFDDQGAVQSKSIHQYGASNRPGNAHYADQAPLFVAQTLKPVWRTRAEVDAHQERTYRPGAE
jgi:acyl-homoserine lactone acylase PvdQ